MKKLLLSFVFLVLSLFVFSQTQTKTIESKKIGKIEWEIVEYIRTTKTYDTQQGKRITKTDTSIYFRIFYQNVKYSHIVDYGSVSFYSKEKLLNFASDLKIMAEKSNQKIGYRKGYLRVSEKSKSIYIENDEWTYINKKQALWLADDIETYYNYLLK